MALTDFAALSTDEKIAWSRDTWIGARNLDYWKRFEGKDQNSVVQRITELTKDDKGVSKCIFTLVADLQGDGVTGDNQREGNEEALTSYNQEIQLDQISHSVGNVGKMAEQKTVINTRNVAQERLKFWLGDIVSQLKFLAASGIDFGYKPDGRARAANSKLKNLAFNADVTAPSSKRSLMWNGSALVTSVTGNIDSTYVPSYKMLTRLRAYAESHYVKPMVADGKEYYNVLMHPWAYALLKDDDYFQKALTQAYPRGPQNPWFTGAVVTIDGLVIHTHRYVYNTSGAAAGSKWGSGGNVNGSRTLLLGAQALAVGDIGMGDWVEKLFDYENRWGINIDKIFGIKKPKFYSAYDQSIEDFGIVCCDHYIPN